jgi:hypothetical protein
MDRDNMRKFKWSKEYQVIFSLLNADTENLLVGWDIEKALNGKDIL